MRADNAGRTLSRPAKAFTSVSAKSPTLAMMENAQKNPGAANLTDIPGFLLGGGVPVKAGSAVIGAIGGPARPAATWTRNAPTRRWPRTRRCSRAARGVSFNPAQIPA